MSLEVALTALQTANASVFPISGGVERRFYIQPKWSLAAFIAGLCSQNYRTLNSMVVVSRDNQQWAPLLNHLFDWARDAKADRYHVRWLEDTPVHGAKASGAYSIGQIVPAEVLQYLAADNNQIIQSMTAAIAGVETNASENPVTRIVAPIVTRVIEEDLKRSATNYGHLVIGTHLEPHLVDAMRRLVRSGKWAPNQPAGRVWVGKEGTFIDWIEAAADISMVLAKDSFAGVPKDPDTLASLLINAELLQLNNEGGRYWTIASPGTLEARDTTVRLKRGESIFPHHFDFSPYQNVQLTLAPPPVPPKAKRHESASTKATTVESEAGTEPTHKQDTPAKSAPKMAIQTVECSAGQMHVGDELPMGRFSCDDSDQELAAIEAATASIEASSSHARREGEHDPSSQTLEARTPKRRKAASAGDTLVSAPESSSRKPSPARQEEPIKTVDRLLGSLKENNATVLREVIDNFHTKKIDGTVAFLPYGVGVPHQELNSHGHPVMDVFEELSAKQWLWVDKAKPSRKIHAVDIDGEIHRLVIIKPDIAMGLGLVKPQ